MREERDEGEEGNNVFGGLDFASVDINGIRKSLEGVEGDAHGQNHLQQEPIRGDMEQLREFSDEEVIVFEQRKDAKVQNDIEGCPKLGLLSCFCLSDEQAAAPRAERGEGDEQQESPVPPAVEDVTCHHHEGILQTQLPLRLADKAVEDEPIKQEYYWQKYCELDGVEEHIVLVFGCKSREIKSVKKVFYYLL